MDALLLAFRQKAPNTQQLLDQLLPSATTTASPQYRELLEIQALLAIAQKNTVLFERTVTRWLHVPTLQRSQRHYMMIGLYLLLLLSQGRIADFHVVLEANEENNVYMDHPRRIQEWLMEGCFNKVCIASE